MRTAVASESRMSWSGLLVVFPCVFGTVGTLSVVPPQALVSAVALAPVVATLIVHWVLRGMTVLVVLPLAFQMASVKT